MNLKGMKFRTYDHEFEIIKHVSDNIWLIENTKTKEQHKVPFNIEKEVLEYWLNNFEIKISIKGTEHPILFTEAPLE